MGLTLVYHVIEGDRLWRVFLLFRPILVLGWSTILGMLWSDSPAAAAQSSPSQSAAAVSAKPVSLTETHWNLIELDGDPVAAKTEQSQPYIYLQEPGDRISGSGGCNRLFGSFDLNGNSLQFHSVASTLMACADNSMEHEAGLLDALKLTTSYQISGSTLQLRVGDRVLARFQPEAKK